MSDDNQLPEAMSQEEMNQYLVSSLGGPPGVSPRASELARQINQLRGQWLACELLARGLPEVLYQHARGDDSNAMGARLVAQAWIVKSGYSYKTPTLNTIELYRYDQLVAKATLFSPAELANYFDWQRGQLARN